MRRKRREGPFCESCKEYVKETKCWNAGAEHGEKNVCPSCWAELAELVGFLSMRQVGPHEWVMPPQPEWEAIRQSSDSLGRLKSAPGALGTIGRKRGESALPVSGIGSGLPMDEVDSRIWLYNKLLEEK